ncbi:MAG: adenylosuccinate synthase [Bacteroidetes bacterium]|nr:adenylosuccinate synthase [Bacteroidota bacterium]MCL2302041.1 adenylosuccinate synthase [Lentimicrobiaceae bacterium]
MKLDILLGLQWGDEGKGKVVDVLTPHYDVIARFQGGPNAGHTLEFNGLKHVLHIIPSGIFHQDKMNIIGNGVVIDPVIFQKEIESLEKMGFDPTKNLFISKKAHLILPTHKWIDAMLEEQKGEQKIGSTLKGIGPTYTDKIARNGFRVCDIIAPDFLDKFAVIYKKHSDLLIKNSYKPQDDITTVFTDWFNALQTILRFKLIDSEYEVNDYLKEEKKVLAEGAQGTLLDVDFGSYPFVTSSTTVAAGACTGLGVAPNRTGCVIGIVKAYCTRVGSGPFPTELFDETGEQLRKQGHEFGSTTGRARRCGWLDLVALKYTIMINGVTEMVLTKADVMDNFDTIKICTAYQIGEETTDRFPTEINADIKPVYKEFKGWKQNLSEEKDYENLPQAFKDYVAFIEKETGIPISIVSTGPDRSQTIIRA